MTPGEQMQLMRVIETLNACEHQDPTPKDLKVFIVLGPLLFLSVTRARLHFVNREQLMTASGLYEGPLSTPALTVVWWPSCTL